MTSLASQKIVISPGVALGAPESYYTEYLSQVFAGAGTFVLPIGWLFIAPNADVSVQYTNDGGTTWNTAFAAGTGGWIPSDGGCWRLNASAATTAIYFGIA